MKMIDLLKFEKPAQFPKDEVLNDKDRIVRSWMSAEVTDRQGDIIPVSELKRVMNTWFKRGATMMDQHTNRPIGRGLKWEEAIHPENNVPGIKLDYQVFDDYTVDNAVWDEIKSGKRTGLSIGGRATGIPQIKVDNETGESGKQLSGLELYEVSPVDKPANQLSENIAINYLAKGITEDPVEFEKKLMSDLKKGFEGDPNKPFGGFGDMDKCMEGQKERGHSEEASQRICTFLQHRTNTQFQKGTLETKDNAVDPQSSEKPDPKPTVALKEDKMPGGIGDSKDPASVDLAQLAMGIEVEMEHTKDPAQAKEIAIDHLTEDPKYYTALAEMEAKADKGPGGHTRDQTGPHGAGAGPGDGKGCKPAKKQDGVGITLLTDIEQETKKGWPEEFCKEIIQKKRVYLKSGQKPQSNSSAAQKDTQPKSSTMAREDAILKNNNNATSQSNKDSTKSLVGWPGEFVKALQIPKEL